MEIWKQLIPSNLWDEFFGLNLTNWLANNLDMRQRDSQRVLIFATAAWRIWTKRCNLVFQPDEICVSDQELLRNINVTV